MSGHESPPGGFDRTDLRSAAALVGAMFVSAGLVLWFGRELTFSGDELSLISLVADLEGSELFEPYVGHLVPVSLLAYRGVLEVFGASEYEPFQILTLISIFTLAWIVFAWGRQRVPAPVALAPALLMVIFPQDLLHYLAGNGFVIVFALACGLGALYAFERNSRAWDLASFGLLVAGLLTYTVAAAFAVGVLVAALLDRDWKRLWVAGLPLLAYAIWRLGVASASAEIEDAAPDFGNLLLLPAWAFQSVGGALAALFGIGFDFLGLIPRDPNSAARYLGPALAIVFLSALGALVVAGRIRRDLVVVGAIALALYASQTVVWASFEDRPGPGETRYLYPAALVVLLVGLEMARGISWDRQRTATLLGVTAISLVSAIGFLVIEGSREGRSRALQAEVLAVTLLESTPDPPPIRLQPRDALRKSFDPDEGSSFGYLGFAEQEVINEGQEWAPRVDSFLAEAQAFRLRPVRGAIPVACRPATAELNPFTEEAILPPRGAILSSARPIDLLLGRYGSDATVDIGPLGPDRPAILRLNRDDGTVPWFVSVARRSPGTVADLVVCRYEPARSASLSSLAPDRRARMKAGA